MLRLSLFRRFARPVAVFLLLAGPAGLWHSGTDDLACMPGGVSESDVAALGAAPSATADHCLVCHWTRLLRSPSPAVARVHSALIVAARVDVQQPDAYGAPALDRGPARAPPFSI